MSEETPPMTELDQETLDHVHTLEELELFAINNWIKKGVEEGWCGPPMCHEHDGRPPENPEEHACPIYIRIYKTIDEMEYVEENHPNSIEFKKRFDYKY